MKTCIRLTWPEPGLINMIFIGNERKLKHLLFSAWSALVHDFRNARGTVVHNKSNASVIHAAIGHYAPTLPHQLIGRWLTLIKNWLIFAKNNVLSDREVRIHIYHAKFEKKISCRWKYVMIKCEWEVNR